MKHLKNFNTVNENILTDLIKLPLKVVGFLLKPLVPILLKIIGKSISVENKWKVIKSVLDNLSKLALDIEKAKDKLKKESDLTPNEIRDLKSKIEKFKKEYPNGFKFSEIKKDIIESVEKNFAKATNKEREEDLKWLKSKISDYKITKINLFTTDMLDDLIVENYKKTNNNEMKHLKGFNELNEGKTAKAAKKPFEKEVWDTDKKETFRTTIKDFLKGKSYKVKQVGDDFEVHVDNKHVAQVMFRKDLVTVKKVGAKFGKDFKYTELGKIKAEISSVTK